MLEQKLSVADAAHGQFEQAYQLVGKIAASQPREALQCARELLRDWPSQQHLAERVPAAAPAPERTGTAPALAAGRRAPAASFTQTPWPRVPAGRS
ncbi:hypothetical protein M8494_16220 [Serratia ureilytica]